MNTCAGRGVDTHGLGGSSCSGDCYFRNGVVFQFRLQGMVYVV